jgi:hypothetical protein
LKQTKSALNGKDINLTGDNTIITSNNFNVDKNGNMSCNNATMNNATMNNANVVGGKIKVGGSESESDLIITGNISDWGTFTGDIYPHGINISQPTSTGSITYIDMSIYRKLGYIQGQLTLHSASGNNTFIDADGITTPTLSQTSLESQKKNFEKMQDGALEILKQIDIYKYNLKNEQDTDKKHIGFVIGNNYNYSKEVTSLDNKGVDNYAFTSLCCKAIQELSQKVEELENKLKEKEENNG